MLRTALLLAIFPPAPMAEYVVSPSVDVGPVIRTALGVNAPDKYIDWSTNAAVHRRMKEGGFGIVRFGLVQDGLYQKRDIYPQKGEWRFEAMDRMLKAVFEAGAQPLISVIGFPAGVPHRLDGDKKIEQADWEEYARFVAGVVKRYNVDQVLGKGRKIRYWEMWNEPGSEPDGKFVSKAQYAEFVRTVVPAMRKVDPSIRIVGPVQEWSDLSAEGWVAYGAKELGSYLDVLCWHDYGGQGDQSDADRMAWPRTHYGDNVRTVLSTDRFVGPGGKRFGTAITEYNMSWAASPPTHAAKYPTAYNAAFTGAALVQALDSGMELFCFYLLMQAGDNHLGILDNRTFEPRRPFYVFPLFARHLGERKVKVTGTHEDLEVLGTRQRGGEVTLFVVNKSRENPRTVRFAIPGRSSLHARAWQVSSSLKGEAGPEVRSVARAIEVSLDPLTVTAIEVR